MTESLRSLSDGNLCLVHFWSKSCPMCHENMPHVQQLRDRYLARGLKVIAIHRPMNEGDLNESRVHEVARELGITEPLVLDNDYVIGDELGVSAWPTYFLFDATGKQRRRAMGNFGIRMMEQALIRLIDESTPDTST